MALWDVLVKGHFKGEGESVGKGELGGVTPCDAVVCLKWATGSSGRRVIVHLPAFQVGFEHSVTFGDMLVRRGKTGEGGNKEGGRGKASPVHENHT